MSDQGSSQFKSYVDLFEETGGQGNVSAGNAPGPPTETGSGPARVDTLDRLVEVCRDGESVTADTDSWLYIPSDVYLPPSSSPTSPKNVTDPSLDENASNTNSLCGFLNKYKVGARGINKVFKRRWFVFADSSCKLLYYRTPQDMIPLGEINISTATFSFDVDNIHEQSVFEIRSQNKTYQLEAQDKHTMLYWLQELQKRRRAHSQCKTLIASDTHKPTESGLLHSPEAKLNDEDFLPCIFGKIDTPEGTMGSSASTSPMHIKDFSIANWRTELKNRVAHWRLQKDQESFESSPSSPPSSRSASESSVTPLSSVKDTKEPSKGHQVAGKLVNIKNRFIRPKSSIDGDPAHPTASKSLCHRCKRLQDQLTTQKEESSLLEDELQATREVVKIIHKQLERHQVQSETRKQWEVSYAENESLLVDLESAVPLEASDVRLKMLHERDQRIVDLEHLLTQTKQQCTILKAQLQCYEKEVRGLKEDIDMYQESIAAKDNIVVSLTERLAESESAGTAGAATPAATDANSFVVDSRDVEKMKDMCEAYRLQNQLLNQELLELSQLRTDDEARELAAQMRYTEMEAKFYQVKSKWMLALKELSKPTQVLSRRIQSSKFFLSYLSTKRSIIPQDYGGPSEEVVCQLLEDAMNTESAGSISKRGSPIRHSAPLKDKENIVYDQFGFPYLNQSTHIHEEDLEDHADDLMRKSNELSSQAKDLEKEISAHVKWENYLVSLGSRSLVQTSELKGMIRTGVPMEYRSRVWKACVEWRSAALKRCCGERHYDALLEHVENILQSSINTPLRRQIEVDLLRTLPDNKHYESITSEGIPKLRRVLLAYTVHNPDVGYCQGLNRVAAIALLFLSEEDAFWCIVAIVESIMPKDYFSSSLISAHADQRVLKDIVADKMPRLVAHLEEHHVDLSLFTFNWFMTIFVDNIPVETFLRIWDSFLYEGSKVLFRYSLAFLKHREEELLSKTSDLRLHEYLRAIGETMTNVNKIANIAFNELNPFPMRMIHSRRQQHLVKIKAEMAKLDEMRLQFESSNSFHFEAPPPEADFNDASDDEQI